MALRCEIYFHRNSVLRDDFARLAVGTRVTYVEEMGWRVTLRKILWLLASPTNA
jgi:hypothetical protein